MKPSVAMRNAEKWHKKNCSRGDIKIVKHWLVKETKTIPITLNVGDKLIHTTSKQATLIPILHNKDKIYLQFCGWSINLLNDGTWHWEDTTGG